MSIMKRVDFSCVELKRHSRAICLPRDLGIDAARTGSSGLARHPVKKSILWLHGCSEVFWRLMVPCHGNRVGLAERVANLRHPIHLRLFNGEYQH